MRFYTAVDIDELCDTFTPGRPNSSSKAVQEVIFWFGLSTIPTDTWKELLHFLRIHMFEIKQDRTLDIEITKAYSSESPDIFIRQSATFRGSFVSRGCLRFANTTEGPRWSLSKYYLYPTSPGIEVTYSGVEASPELHRQMVKDLEHIRQASISGDNK